MFSFAMLLINYIFLIFINSILYELITGRTVWKNLQQFFQYKLFQGDIDFF